MTEIIKKETMTSLEIAGVTSKRHDSVLRDIRNLLSQGVDAHNFVETSYTDRANRQQKCFALTKKGCLILASGYDALLREKIINRREELETEAREDECIKPKTQLEILQLSINQLVEQEHRLSSVEHRLDAMDKEREENRRLLLEAETSKNKVPSITMRNNIRKLVNQYSKATNTDQQDVWYKVYDNLYYIYSISINSYKKNKRQTKLDVAEKHGFLSKIFDIISDMVNSKR